tara:strand:- start:359 stop:610 length:252 start_codon:yes stop_codon:yes gene_type:complete
MFATELFKVAIVNDTELDFKKKAAQKEAASPKPPTTCTSWRLVVTRLATAVPGSVWLEWYTQSRRASAISCRSAHDIENFGVF